MLGFEVFAKNIHISVENTEQVFWAFGICLTQVHTDFSPVFSSRSFIALVYLFKSVPLLA